MTAHDIIRDLQSLPPDEQARVKAWLDEQVEESQGLLDAVDAGLADLAAGRVTVFEREELSAKVAAWAGKSR